MRPLRREWVFMLTNCKSKDAQAFVARMDSAIIKHIGYKTVADLRHRTDKDNGEIDAAGLTTVVQDGDNKTKNRWSLPRPALSLDDLKNT